MAELMQENTGQEDQGKDCLGQADPAGQN